MKRTVLTPFGLCLFAAAELHSVAGVPNPVHIDFSYAGYAANESKVPNAKALVAVTPTGHDDTELLQSALDRVANSPADAKGLRGAVLLRPGVFHVRGQLRLKVSGVVLRGSGEDKTTVVAEGDDRRTLIEVGGSAEMELGDPVTVTEDVQAGERTIKLATVDALRAGDAVVVRRPSTREWIAAIGMSGLPGTFANQRLDWQPGSHDLSWDRTITRVDPSTKQIELDAPITTALESKYGGGTVTKIRANPGLLTQAGVEDMTLASAYDPRFPKDEDHSWIAIAIDHLQDGWVRHVTTRHFVASAVRVGRSGRRITIEDCRSEQPVSEIGGYRRQSFVVYGQQVLVTRCYSEEGMNDFAVGLLAAGPNVFFDCQSKRSNGANGSFEGWSSGVLYEKVRVDGASLQLLQDPERAQGAGWTSANSLIWNSAAQSVDVLGPPGAYNYKVDSKESLLTTELSARGLLLDADTGADPVGATLPTFQATTLKKESEPPQHPFAIVNGRFVVDGKVVWGQSQNEAWWRGDTSPLSAAQSTGSSITRFMPGQNGPGMTEVLPEFVDRLKSRGIKFYISSPGLWYEHRRDAHNDYREPNGNVWAPFYEMPWARSGKGTAWDGLSLYDVSRYNPWYFERHREFIKLAGEQGLIVYVNLYNNHDVNEIGPHWIDYAWRPANNINDTGLPEPPPLRPNNRNDVGTQFFNVDYAPLRKLHHDYIFHTLDEMGDLPNVIFTAAYQYAGPLKFEQFLQDTIAEWEALHNRHVRIALVTGKNIVDAIMSDPVRSRQISAIDMRYWEYQPDGTLFAPEAGQNRAFRELITERFPGYTDTPPPTTPEMVYRQVREYRDKYPNVALLPMEEGAGPIPILMGGAASESSLRGGIVMPAPSPRNPTGIPGPPPRNQAAPPSAGMKRGLEADTILAKFVADYLASDLTKMGPVDGIIEDGTHNWVLGGSATDTVLIDAREGAAFTLAKALPLSRYHGMWFDPASGATREAGTVSGAKGQRIAKPDTNEWLLLLTRS